ncbi:MAG: phosphonoacetaldehyde reductase [Candidatus Alkaliphilus sp. MAG34]
MSCFYNPVRIKWGSEIIKNLSEIIAKSNLNMKNILILTGSESLKKSGKLDTIMRSLNNRKIFVCDGVPSNPEINELFNFKLATDKLGYDSIVAIGGGSVLDMGKCLAAFKNLQINGYSALKPGINDKRYQNSNINIPIIAIPTTAGTGSEVTSWATIWDKENNKKYSIEDERLYPKIAIIDPMLMINLPLRLTVSTALDALCHASEAYWSKKTNEIVRMYALSAIRLIMENLNDLIDNLDDLNLRTKIAQASLYAGLAFSNTKTTACHSISYPLTSKYNIPHGIATSMTLANFFNINKESITDKNALLDAFGVREISQIKNKVDDILLKSKIPFRLKDYNIVKSDIDLIIKKSFTPDRMNNNPVKVTRELLREVLEDIY